MKLLKEVTSHFSNIYVSRSLLNQSDLHAWAISQGFTSTIRDMHVTIAFSKNAINWDWLTPQTDQMNIIETNRRELKQYDDACCLTFYSYILWLRWYEIRNHGATWSHDTYYPHVTISYKTPKIPIKKMKPYTGPLLFGPEEFKAIDFMAKNKQQNTEY